MLECEPASAGKKQKADLNVSVTMQWQSDGNAEASLWAPKTGKSKRNIDNYWRKKQHSNTHICLYWTLSCTCKRISFMLYLCSKKEKQIKLHVGAGQQGCCAICHSQLQKFALEINWLCIYNNLSHICETY